MDAPHDGDKPPDPPPNDLGTYAQQFQHQPVSARVPERLARGAITTGVLVLDSPNEFVLDFLQSLTRPYQIVARVIVVPAIMDQVVTAASDNLAKYIEAFGTPPVLPKPPQRRPTIAEIYENFKLPDENLSGAYANSIMVGHSPAEFFFDFITGFYPTAAVSARVLTAAPHMPRIVDTLKMALQQYRNRYSPPPP
ncbi:MAG TPA: DUF3467 domain-containing protein [Tepidisphaeraceae bacterium]|jgi:hypothetical protein|nr:DUF3467 domain-containing protein [Tepidisphaeraceae bacterium]